MSVEKAERDEILTTLADGARSLMEDPYDSPKVGLWKRRARDFIGQEFGDEYVKILDRALRFGFVIHSESHAEQLHREAMGKAITFLEELRSEEPVAPDAKEPEQPRALLHLEELHPKVVNGCAELYNTGHLAKL
jgi:hypothetical protein